MQGETVVTHQFKQPTATQTKQAMEALRLGQVDAVIADKSLLVLRLHEAEQARRRSEQRLRRFMDRNPDAVLCLDLEGRITEANHAAARLTGYRTEELLGKSWRDLCHTADWDAAHQAFRDALTGGISKLQCPTVVCRDGSLKDVYLTGGRLRENCRITGLFLIGRDLSEIKRIEEDLHQHQAELKAQNDQLRQAQADLEASRSRYTDLFDFAPLGYFELDDKGHIEIANLTGAYLLNVERESMKGQVLDRYGAPDQRDKLYRHRQEVFASSRQNRCELMMQRRDHDAFAAELLFDPVKDRSSQVTHCRVALIDISKRRAAETALHNLNLDLEQRIEQRTEALKKTVEQLKKIQSYLMQAHRIASLGIWEWDIDSGAMKWSDEIYILFEADPERSERTYEFFMSHVHPEDRQHVQQKVDNALANQALYAVEHRIVQSNGSERIVHQRGEVVYNAAHEPVRMIGTLQDITEERNRERRLLQQQYELKSQAELLDLAHDMIIVHDLEGRIQFWNKGAERVYGWKREEVLGRVTHEVLKTRFEESPIKIIAAVSAWGTWEGELTLETRDGHRLIVESRWALQQDEKGRPAAILEIDRDITHRKVAEQEREETRRYAENIIESIEEAILVLDNDLYILSANKGFHDLFNTTPDWIGRHLFELEDRHWHVPEFKFLLESILPENRRIDNYEIEYPTDKGTVTLLLNAKEIFHDKPDKKRHILMAFHDVTIHKLQEQALKELTEELLFAEEKQRQNVATALHDSIGQMLAFSKRELSALLKKQNAENEPALRKVLEMIGASINQSRQLTTDLSSPTLHTFGLEAAIEELAEQFTKDHGPEVMVNVTQEPKPLDKKIELLLYRSIKELLCNIAKHAQAETVKIEIQTDDHCIDIIVSDDGKGFDVPAYELGQKETNSFGLFSIRQRLININGLFTINSEKNNGTRCHIRTPLKKVDESQKIQQETVE
jgi:PAS domain S-box-containing protein